MMSWVQRAASPATLIAVLALIAAVVGTAIAGPKQSNTAKTAKKALKLARKNQKRINRIQRTPGPQGPHGAQGPQGSQGPQGEPATKLWAVVNSDATLRKGSGVVSVSGNLASSHANVKFERNIDECAIVASLGRASGAFIPGQVIADEFVLSGFGKDEVLVETTDSTGAVSARSFHLAVFC